MFSFNMPSTLISWFIFILIFRYRPLLIVVFYSSFVSIATAVQWLTLVPLKSCFFLDPNQKTPQFSQKWCDSSILKSFLVCQAKIRPLCTLVFFQIPSPSAQNGPFCFLKWSVVPNFNCFILQLLRFSDLLSCSGLMIQEPLLYFQVMVLHLLLVHHYLEQVPMAFHLHDLFNLL